MLPKSIEKILYLDSDVVVTDDISSLFDIYLLGNAIRAVQRSAITSGRLTHSLPSQ